VILLDTHAAIWLAIDQGLGKESRRMADKALADDRLTISAISFWELGMLIAKRRLRAAKSAGELRAKLLATGIRDAAAHRRDRNSRRRTRKSHRRSGGSYHRGNCDCA